MKWHDRIVKILTFQESRKVGLGLWLIIFANWFLAFDKITGAEWIVVAGMASALVGGGTVADSYMRKKPDALPLL